MQIQNYYILFMANFDGEEKAKTEGKKEDEIEWRNQIRMNRIECPDFVWLNIEYNITYMHNLPDDKHMNGTFKTFSVLHDNESETIDDVLLCIQMDVCLSLLIISYFEWDGCQLPVTSYQMPI